MKQRLFIRTPNSYSISLSKIKEIEINNKIYYRNKFIQNNGKFMNLFYIFIEQNLMNISYILTSKYKYTLYEGTLHSFDGVAVKSLPSEDTFTNISLYYIYGIKTMRYINPL